MMQKISIDSVIFCENSKYTFGLCNLYTFKRVLASSNVCPFLSAKFLQLQDVFPQKSGVLYRADGVCEGGGASHRFVTVPPSWTFGHRVERTAARAQLLCPPGNTRAS